MRGNNQLFPVHLLPIVYNSHRSPSKHLLSIFFPDEIPLGYISYVHLSLIPFPHVSPTNNSLRTVYKTVHRSPGRLLSKGLCFINCVSLRSIVLLLFGYLHLLNVVSLHFTTAIFHHLERKEGFWCYIWKWEWEKDVRNGLDQGLLCHMYVEGTPHPMSRHHGGHPCHSEIQVEGIKGGIGDC